MTDLDPGRYRKLAADLLSDTVSVLRQPPPPSRPPSNRSRAEWVRSWEVWEQERMRDLRFIRDPERSASWCEAAGVDYDAVVSRLEDEGSLYDPKDRFPLALGGREIVKPKTTIRETKPEPKRTRKNRRTEKQIPCPDCGIPCRGSGALKLHEAACVGRESMNRAVELYRDSDLPVQRILEKESIHPDMLYRLLKARGIKRRQPRSGTRGAA